MLPLSLIHQSFNPLVPVSTYSPLPSFHRGSMFKFPSLSPCFHFIHSLTLYSRCDNPPSSLFCIHLFIPMGTSTYSLSPSLSPPPLFFFPPSHYSAGKLYIIEGYSTPSRLYRSPSPSVSFLTCSLFCVR